jgi:hypothetical protein
MIEMIVSTNPCVRPKLTDRAWSWRQSGQSLHPLTFIAKVEINHQAQIRGNKPKATLQKPDNLHL